jgi:hypothetical protein
MVVLVGAAYGLHVAGMLPAAGTGPGTDAAGIGLKPPTAASASASAGVLIPIPSSTGGASTVYPALPGLGTVFGSQIPANSTQVVVAYGDSVIANTTIVDFYEKVSGGWQLADSWAGHNGDAGWTTGADQTSGDLKSPMGVYALTDASGKLLDPGTELTQVYISIPQDGVKTLLDTLNPADDPVLMMADRADLAAD